MPQLHVDIVTDSSDFWARMANEGRKAGQVGEQLGKAMGQGITRGAGGGTLGGGNNMANSLGLGNNFVFAIQDASSAIGQFGATTTGLRFMILGAANNIQMMAMSAAMAGTGFKGLLAAITPLHIGLAIFSAGVSLLPLLFSSATKASDQAGDAFKDFTTRIKDSADAMEKMNIAIGMGIIDPNDSPLKIMERQASELRDTIIDLIAKENELFLAKNKGEALRFVAEAETRDAKQQLKDKEAEIKNATIAQKILPRLPTSTGGRPAELFDKMNKESMDALNDSVRVEIDSKQDEAKLWKDRGQALRDLDEKIATNKWAKESARITNSFLEQRIKLRDLGLDRPDRTSAIDQAERKAQEDVVRRQQKEDRDQQLNAKQLDLELRKLRMPSFSGAGTLTSPDELVNRIQKGANETEERQIDNQLKQIQIAEKQNQLTDMVIDNLKIPFIRI